MERKQKSTTVLTQLDIMEQKKADADKIAKIFADLSDESKMIIKVYVSALRDKENADSCRQSVIT